MITTPGKVRDVFGGTREVKVDDAQIISFIKDAELAVKRDLFEYKNEVTPSNNPATGQSWNGGNTRFQIPYPVMDHDFDESTTDDVEGIWIDSSYDIQTLSVSVHNAYYGLIDVYQSNGTTAIPNSAIDIKVKYYKGNEEISFSVCELAGTYFAAQSIYDMLTDPSKLSLADIESNKRILQITPDIFKRKYWDLVHRYSAVGLRAT